MARQRTAIADFMLAVIYCTPEPDDSAAPETPHGANNFPEHGPYGARWKVKVGA